MQTLHTLTHYLNLYYIYTIACKIKCAVLKERLYVKGSENETPRLFKKSNLFAYAGRISFCFLYFQTCLSFHLLFVLCQLVSVTLNVLSVNEDVKGS